MPPRNRKSGKKSRPKNAGRAGGNDTLSGGGFSANRSGAGTRTSSRQHESVDDGSVPELVSSEDSSDDLPSVMRSKTSSAPTVAAPAPVPAATTGPPQSKTSATPAAALKAAAKKTEVKKQAAADSKGSIPELPSGSGSEDERGDSAPPRARSGAAGSAGAATAASMPMKSASKKVATNPANSKATADASNKPSATPAPKPPPKPAPAAAADSDSDSDSMPNLESSDGSEDEAVCTAAAAVPSAGKRTSPMKTASRPTIQASSATAGSTKDTTKKGKKSESTSFATAAPATINTGERNAGDKDDFEMPSLEECDSDTDSDAPPSLDDEVEEQSGGGGGTGLSGSVPNDPLHARNFYETAAARGDAEAQFKLAQHYAEGGGGLSPSPAQARVWMERAAKQDHAEAQYLMGIYCGHCYGGGARSETTARGWFKKAAAQGTAEHQCSLALDLHCGVGGQVASKANALLWFRNAAERGNAEAQYYLGQYYEEGLGNLPGSDLKKAKDFYQKAAKQDHAGAMYSLAGFYQNGMGGLKKNLNQANKHLEQAAEKGHVLAQCQLAAEMERGIPGRREPDLAGARLWYGQAARKGNEQAHCKLGDYYFEGLAGLSKDPGSAYNHYHEAARRQHVRAMYMVAQFLDHPEGMKAITPNRDQALKWAAGAACQGQVAAMYLLAKMHSPDHHTYQQSAAAAFAGAGAGAAGKSKGSNSAGKGDYKKTTAVVYGPADAKIYRYWLEEASKFGVADASCDLACTLFAEATGPTPSPDSKQSGTIAAAASPTAEERDALRTRARELLESGVRSAATPHARSQFQLAKLFHDNRTTSQSRLGDEARRLYEASAALNYIPAQQVLGVAYASQLGRLTPDQRAAGRKYLESTATPSTKSTSPAGSTTATNNTATTSAVAELDSDLRKKLLLRYYVAGVGQWSHEEVEEFEGMKTLAVTAMQKLWRGHAARGIHCPELRKIRGTWNKFSKKWSVVLSLLSTPGTHAGIAGTVGTVGVAPGEASSQLRQFYWSDVKRLTDMAVVYSENSPPNPFLEKFQRLAQDTLQNMANATAVDTSEGDGGEEEDDEDDDDDDEEGNNKGSEIRPVAAAMGAAGGIVPMGGRKVLKAQPIVAVELAYNTYTWLEAADATYKHMCLKRLIRLAKGDRSYAMSKRLKHIDTPIFETKLDKGMRILWTHIKRAGEDHIVVWNVSKHDDVPKYAEAIDKSCKRASAQASIRAGQAGRTEQDRRDSAIDLAPAKQGYLSLGEDAVLIDPNRNVPLKVYLAEQPEMSALLQEGLDEWKNQFSLKLNKKERSVRSQEGTVLLLGRSGTGKTLCLIDRMANDCKTHGSISSVTRAVDRMGLGAGKGGGVNGKGVEEDGKPFRQLFVTRSPTLCNYVKSILVSKSDTGSSSQQQHQEAQLHPHHYMKFLNLEEFFEKYNELVPLPEEIRYMMPPLPPYSTNKRVDYRQFRDTVYPKIKQSSKLDPLVMWSQIKSFLKGSIEAVLEGGELSLESYQKFSKDRCRLQKQQREEAYEVYLRYKVLCQESGYWDDMDRVLHLLQPRLGQLQQAANSHSYGGGGSGSGGGGGGGGGVSGSGGWDDGSLLRYDRTYVDEVQDNTQAEIALFFLAAARGKDALFLAGDPAQSVVEGVEFRFEEVRSLVYQLTGNQESLQRPTKLLVNYRSHSGVLNCAAGVLDLLLAMFPGSAKTLPKDEGLFTGPRPSYLVGDEPFSCSPKHVKALLSKNKRLTVVCADYFLTKALETLGDASDSSPEASGSNRGGKEGQNKSAAAAEKEGRILRPEGLDNPMFGVRAAKGLEFNDVLLLDMFCSLPSSSYKAWHVLFGADMDPNGAASGTMPADQQYSYPELEPQLKRLYTAVTRSVNRLIFAETQSSKIGSVFFRWLERRGLGEKLKFSRVEQDSSEDAVLTTSEVNQQGIDIAVAASGMVGDAMETARMFQQACDRFRRAENTELLQVAEAGRKLASMRAQYETLDMTAQSIDEEKLVDTVHSCLKTGMLDEVRRFCLREVSGTLDAPIKQYFLGSICKPLQHIRPQE